MLKTIITLAIAIATYGALMYTAWWCFVGACKRQVKRQAGVKKLSDLYVTEEGEVVKKGEVQL